MPCCHVCWQTRRACARCRRNPLLCRLLVRLCPVHMHPLPVLISLPLSHTHVPCPQGRDLDSLAQHGVVYALGLVQSGPRGDSEEEGGGEEDGRGSFIARAMIPPDSPLDQLLAGACAYSTSTPCDTVCACCTLVVGMRTGVTVRGHPVPCFAWVLSVAP